MHTVVLREVDNCNLNLERCKRVQILQVKKKHWNWKWIFGSKIGFNTAENEPQKNRVILPLPPQAQKQTLLTMLPERVVSCFRSSGSSVRYAPVMKSLKAFLSSRTWAERPGANLKGLVLSCIEATFCKKICVWKLSPRSTECTALHCTYSQIETIQNLKEELTSKIHTEKIKIS